MDTVLGLLGVVVFIVVMISLSAAVTYAVVKLTPDRHAAKRPEADSEA